jgi:hypothetical protein
VIRCKHCGVSIMEFEFRHHVEGEPTETRNEWWHIPAHGNQAHLFCTPGSGLPGGSTGPKAEP